MGIKKEILTVFIVLVTALLCVVTVSIVLVVFPSVCGVLAAIILVAIIIGVGLWLCGRYDMI